MVFFYGQLFSKESIKFDLIIMLSTGYEPNYVLATATSVHVFEKRTNTYVHSLCENSTQ
jgi:hypothetical protein